MKIYKTLELFDYSKTIAESLLLKSVYPWEILDDINSFIISIGKTLSLDKFNHPSEDVWIAKSANVTASASISGACIIDENAQIRHCAFIRGSVIIGKNSVVGNSTELKNCIIFNDVQVPHYNYIGDSILGYKSHLGAGAVTSNVKSDKSIVTIKLGDVKKDIGRKKVGAMVGDYVEIGCNSVLFPGSIIGKNTTIYPLSKVRGVVPENSIYKNFNDIIKKT